MSQEIPEGYIVKSTRFHGPNVVSCEIVSGNQLTPLIGYYLPPSTLYHLPHLEETLNPFLDRDPIILGGLNADIIRLRNPREQQVADFLAYFGLVCLLAHFLQHLCYCNLQTWWQVGTSTVISFGVAQEGSQNCVARNSRGIYCQVNALPWAKCGKL